MMYVKQNSGIFYNDFTLSCFLQLLHPLHTKELGSCMLRFGMLYVKLSTHHWKLGFLSLPVFMLRVCVEQDAHYNHIFVSGIC